MTDLPVPQFKIGDVVWRGKVESVSDKHPCPDCLGSRTWSVTTPAGSVMEMPCARCSGSYRLDSVPSLGFYKKAASVRRLTVGSVRIDTSNRANEQVSYMCNETGIGSGSVYYEGTLCATEDEARVRAEAEASIANADAAAAPERIQQARLSSQMFKTAVVCGASDAVWDAWYAYRRLREDFEEVIKDESIGRDDWREAIKDKLKWERTGRSLPSLGKLLAVAADAAKTHPELAELLADLPRLDVFKPEMAESR